MPCQLTDHDHLTITDALRVQDALRRDHQGGRERFPQPSELHTSLRAHRMCMYRVCTACAPRVQVSYAIGGVSALGEVSHGHPGHPSHTLHALCTRTARALHALGYCVGTAGGNGGGTFLRPCARRVYRGSAGLLHLDERHGVLPGIRVCIAHAWYAWHARVHGTPGMRGQDFEVTTPPYHATRPARTMLHPLAFLFRGSASSTCSAASLP